MIVTTVKPVQDDTFGTIQKWSSWKDGRLMKNLYKVTTNQIWSLLADFSFTSNGEYFIRNKRFWCFRANLDLLLILNVHILKRHNTIAVHIFLHAFSQ